MFRVVFDGGSRDLDRERRETLPDTIAAGEQTYELWRDESGEPILSCDGYRYKLVHPVVERMPSGHTTESITDRWGPYGDQR